MYHDKQFWSLYRVFTIGLWLAVCVAIFFGFDFDTSWVNIGLATVVFICGAIGIFLDRFK
ncbi:hypothetical protein [Mycolicibacterium llatzerense]|uniref:hypothetical protein n=1 Tax=Mycolicibacterium llatzerense TaxID=280871 RepID=UPI0008DD5B1F|nr:hypothetical protein [Mycolicibacterium llatzerense]